MLSQLLASLVQHLDWNHSEGIGRALDQRHSRGPKVDPKNTLYLCVSTEISSLETTSEKYFGTQTNYVKGKESTFSESVTELG